MGYDILDGAKVVTNFRKLFNKRNWAMDIGFLGLGKLGLPVALAIESKGHNVMGCDVSNSAKEAINSKKIIHKEKNAQRYLEQSNIKCLDIESLVSFSEIIFVAIQTPHSSEHEGITRIPQERVDFNYSYLKEGIKTLSAEIDKQGNKKIVVIISTVLPGTMRREIKPLLGEHSKLCYNPSFIAMGTVIRDYLYPEFILLGVDDTLAMKHVEEFYKTITKAPVYKTNIENAELIKVLYNTFITTKLAFTNIAMELCHKLPDVNIDCVMNALKMANARLISDAYLTGGMGDGGSCHPRDNIALSWLSRKVNLSCDWFEYIMLQREKQTEWFADLIDAHAYGREIIILGKAFKSETNIVTGSPSLLLRNIVQERGHSVIMWDPHIDEPIEKACLKSRIIDKAKLYFIGTKHAQFVDFPFVAGSMVLDPWRYIPDKPGIEVMRIGE